MVKIRFLRFLNDFLVIPPDTLVVGANPNILGGRKGGQMKDHVTSTTQPPTHLRTQAPADPLYSGLLECPMTTRLAKNIDGVYQVIRPLTRASNL